MDAVVILDSAMRSGRVKAATLRKAAQAARGHGDACLETQVRLPGVNAGPVDFVLDGRLVVETDGYEYHRKRADYRNDRARANQLALRGYTLLRFTYEDVQGRPWWVLAQVQAMLDRGPKARDPRCEA